MKLFKPTAIHAALLSAAMAFCSGAIARDLPEACRGDAQKLENVCGKPGSDGFHHCVREHINDLSPSCKQFVREHHAKHGPNTKHPLNPGDGTTPAPATGSSSG